MNTKEHVILLVDASGSMSDFQKETRKSIYSIITKLDKNTHFTLVFFDTGAYNIVADNYVKNIEPNVAYAYKSNGGTPITDSVYKAIQEITKQIDDIELLSEKHKFIIFTDGEENSSKYVKETDLGRAIEHFSSVFGWNFQFIGPKSQEKGIKKYTQSIQIKPENITLYASVADGLKAMEQQTIN